MLKMVDGTGIIGVDMVCPLGATISPPQPPNYDNVEMKGVGSLTLPNSLIAPLERVELSGNSTQGENPTPEAPQEIKSVGRKSKNLFNKNAVKQGYEFGSMATDTETVKQGWFVSDFMPVKATTYYISGKKTGSGCKLYNKDKVFVKNIQAPFGGIKFDDGIAYFRINGEIKDLDKIQAEEGNAPTDYEPYGYLLDLKVTGKNLFNKELIKKAMQGVSYLYVPIYVKKGSKVSFSYSKTLPSGLNFYVLLARDMGASYGSYSWLYHSTATSLCNNEGTFVADNDVISLSFFGSDLDIMIENLFNYLQIEISDKPTPYQPYTEQFAKIALDEPLRGIGEYKDTITKDGVVRKIHEQTLIKEQISMNEYNWDTKYFRLYVNPDKKIDSSINIHELFSNMFKKFVIYKGNPNVYWIISEEEIRSMGITETDSLQVAYEKIKDFVTTNDIVIQYPIVETTLEPLRESVQQQLQALHTENGITHVFVDSGEVPCGIKLTYRKEK